MKIVISGSVSQQKDYAFWIKKFKQHNYTVLDYPKPCEDLQQEYPELFKHFFQSIEATDVLFLLNKKKNGVEGYIGAAGFSELAYAVAQKLLHNKTIRIILFQKPAKDVHCFSEIELWLSNQWIELYSETQILVDE
ncbi:hypothetical protein ACYSNR_13635 [Enterococcus sp. LJL128]|uniref:hypothetical protein n=1 Tax=Enterococcus sp. LJL51 TaxID=3416656 RepID=UPI003CE8BD50